MTAFITWKDYYSVGESSLDAQHKKIIEMVNELYTAIQQDTENRLVKPLLDQLNKYAVQHFAYEEKLMTQAGYPNLAAHKAVHDQLRQRTMDLRKHVGLVTGSDLLYFLKQWWLTHIQEEDKQYAPYMEPVASR